MGSLTKIGDLIRSKQNKRLVMDPSWGTLVTDFKCSSKNHMLAPHVFFFFFSLFSFFLSFSHRFSSSCFLRQMRRIQTDDGPQLCRSTWRFLCLLREKKNRNPPRTTTLSVLTALFRIVSSSPSEKGSKSTAIDDSLGPDGVYSPLLSSSPSEEGSKSTTIDDSLGSDCVTCVISCFLSVLTASPPLIFVFFEWRMMQTHHGRGLYHCSSKIRWFLIKLLN